MSYNKEKYKHHTAGHREIPKFKYPDDFKWFSCASCGHFCMMARITRPVFMVCVQCLNKKTSLEELNPILEDFKSKYPKFFEIKNNVLEEIPK